MLSRRGTASSVRRNLLIAVLAVAAACAIGMAAAATPQAKRPAASETTPVVFAGNNWDGTADVLRFTPPSRPGKSGDFTRIARINIIPDRDQRMQEITTNPQRLAFFLAIRQGIGEGNDQFVDDMYSTNDGTHLIVSRPSFADVVSINLATRRIDWRFTMDGQRSDHMGLSPDGNYVAVSDSTANVVHVLDTATGGQRVNWSFPSGDSPHENT